MGRSLGSYELVVGINPSFLFSSIFLGVPQPHCWSHELQDDNMLWGAFFHGRCLGARKGENGV